MAGKDLCVNHVFLILDANTVAVSISHGNVSVTETGVEFSVIKVRFSKYFYCIKLKITIIKDQTFKCDQTIKKTVALVHEIQN